MGEFSGFRDIVKMSHWTVVIAPETGGILAEQVRVITRYHGRPLGPSLNAIALTSDKLALAEHWRKHRVPTPLTTVREPTACEAFPVVWKPRDGAGSVATFRLDSYVVGAEAPGHLYLDLAVLAALAAACFALVWVATGGLAGLELVAAGLLCAGVAAVPLAPDLQERAHRLAGRAARAVPGLRGYFGVDLVLGPAPDGRADFAIEVNPRLTTSYVGLRALADFNLAEAMLRAAAGEPCGPLRWKPGRVRFAPDGAVEFVAPHG